ncbi:hypothetical protein PFISCL1PPCAC_5170, partial [Pristionchus fissidentatus]
NYKMTSSPPLPLCSVCARQSAGEGGAPAIRVADETRAFECALCFGILHPTFIEEVAKAAEAQLASCPYDATSFILALNLPTSQTLREQIIKKRFPAFNGILVDIPFKVRNINAYLNKLQQASGLRPTLMSDLQLTITFDNDDFLEADTEFLRKAFPQEFRSGKKRRQNGGDANGSNGGGGEPELTKNRLMNMLGRIDEKLAGTFPIDNVPTRACKYSFAFERDPIYIAGRYCKYSRALPQSPWSADEDATPVPGHSVSEKVTGPIIALLGASETRFVASGREDIDVRMLGEGRPFVVHAINCRNTRALGPDRRVETLAALREAINKSSIDVSVSELALLSREVAEQLSVGQEDKKKLYTAYCYSTLPIDKDQLAAATRSEPLEIIQKTPVRVMKRRALLDRPRSIYTLQTMPLDEHHFIVRMETQAGTYIKEFVHGDFGRTRPSLADLIGCEKGEVDIVELDVERVDLVWPPADTGKKDEKKRV